MRGWPTTCVQSLCGKAGNWDDVSVELNLKVLLMIIKVKETVGQIGGLIFVFKDNS